MFQYWNKIGATGFRQKEKPKGVDETRPRWNPDETYTVAVPN